MSSAAMERPLPGMPQWIASSLHVTSGRDPIGLQTITIDRIMPQLVPAILALSQRARYFSLHTFLLLENEERRLTQSNRALSRFIKEKEYEFALAVQLCPNCPSVRSGAVGNRRASPPIASGVDPLDRGESVQSELGGYGLYYRSPLIDLGIVAPAGSALAYGESTPVDVLTSGLGRELGLAFRDAIADTDYYRHFMYEEGPIPRSVLQEFASVACLCRLAEFPDEQEVIRQVLFTDSPAQSPGAVGQRRRSFALFLWLLQQDPGIADSEAAFRAAIWRSFQSHLGDSSPLGETLGQWGALVAKEYLQEALSTIWEATCRVGQQRQSPDGMSADAFQLFMQNDLVGTGTLSLPGGMVSYDPESQTRAFASELTSAAGDSTLEELRGLLTGQRSAMAGLALLLSVIERLPPLSSATRGWIEIGQQRSTWQPGLLQLSLQIGAHLEANPTLFDTMSWLVRQRVVAVHERVAYAKLPEFTFRFRWENDRLHFYRLFGAYRFDPTDSRRTAISLLSADMGLWLRSATGAAQHLAAGHQLVQEVFG